MGSREREVSFYPSLSPLEYRDGLPCSLTDEVDVSKLEACPAIRCVGHCHRPVVACGDVGDHRESEPDPCVARRVAVLEDSLALRLRDARAVVGDVEPFSELPDGDGGVQSPVVEGVPEQVLEQLV